MPSVNFKLMGVFGDASERQILVDSELSIEQIKVLVKKEFKLVPNAKITLLHNGKKIEDDTLPFIRVGIDPRKEKINVIVSNPYS